MSKFNKRYFVSAEHDKTLLVVELSGNVYGYGQRGNKHNIGMFKSEILREKSINNLREISECEAALIINS